MKKKLITFIVTAILLCLSFFIIYGFSNAQQSLSKTKNKLKSGDSVTAQFAPSIPFPQLAAPLRTSDTVSLTMSKVGKGQKSILLDQPKLTMENTMTFTIPASILPGSYKLTLKTYFGVTSYDVQVVK
mgnify:CR=1 FL=1